jgi:adenosylcobinamide-phosphate synthase
MEDLIALPAGFLLDLVLGDPRNWPHPVRWIGKLIVLLEPLLRRRVRSERWGGVLLLLLIAGITGGLVAGLLALASWIHPFVRLIVSTLLIYYGVSAQALAWEAVAVVDAEVSGHTDQARQRLSGIVGRDTQNLEDREVYRACVETVAENTNDGVVAPLFFAGLLGPVGMWVYKAINTLDSMVGYKNDKYRDFGWASARADDIVNLLPARLAYLLIALSAFITRQDGWQALRIGWRDGRKHPSPNAGWPEAAMAGALHVQLGGPSTYAGVESSKPLLGDALEPLRPYTVKLAVEVMRATAWLGLVVGVVVRVLVLVMWRKWASSV